MATETVTVVKSDLTGEADAATVTFGLEGDWYEIDLTDKEKKKLQNLLNTYVSKGRRATKKGEKKKQVPATTAEEREEIRAWGRENDFDVPEFGRIPKVLQKAYDEAHGIKRDK
ncbi:Lsr2 family protein [Streptomyces sp. NPDC056061]|uniref:histone-like nucleoid-structuring protein Lsr2 n=1 Tax=Streptomyces sp. NPDC056061 TaxID=3345700 RepID=UPI0035D75A80